MSDSWVYHDEVEWRGSSILRVQLNVKIAVSMLENDDAGFSLLENDPHGFFSSRIGT